MVLTPIDTAKAVTMIQEGRSQYYVARTLGVKRCTVQRVVERFRETGEYRRGERSGGRRCTSGRDDRFISVTVPGTRHTTAVEARNQLEMVRDVNVSERTIR